MLLLIDNYDSFAYNLARYFGRLGVASRVVRNDECTCEDIRRWQPAAIVMSPGPCTPQEAGISLELVREFRSEIPQLGVCLGHQAIAAACGGVIVRAPQPVHGRTSPIFHRGDGLFRDLPNPLSVGRYHSLVVERETLPAELEVTAETEDGLVMALRHREWPLFGVQFHPESILTPDGFALLHNYLESVGITSPRPTAAWFQRELNRPKNPERPLPDRPVTF